MSALTRKNRIAFFFASLAQSFGVSVAEFGEMTLDEVRRRRRS